MTTGDKPRDFADPRRGNAIVRIFRGFGYLFEGWAFVFSRHPSLLKFCLLPLLINILVFSGVAVSLYFYYGDLVALIWAKPETWLLQILWYLAYIFIFLIILLLAYLAFFIVQALLSAPFNDLLSERVEILTTGEEPPAFSWDRLIRGLGKTMLHELAKLGIWVAIMAPAFLVSFVPVIGKPVFAVIGFYITATFFAYDYIDYSMARREWTFKEKRALLKQNRALSFGFGSSLAVALLIPVVGLLCVPMAAVGGTLLFCDLQWAVENDGGEGEDAAPSGA